MVRRWRSFGEFVSCIAASHVQHISDVHSKFALSTHYVWKYGRHPIATAENRRRKKKEEKGKKPQPQNIMDMMGRAVLVTCLVCPVADGTEHKMQPGLRGRAGSYFRLIEPGFPGLGRVLGQTIFCSSY